MKKFLLFLTLIFISNSLLFAQGADCLSMEPICTDVGATFPASQNTTAEAGNNYDCLLSVPNPAWYYFEVATNGNIDMELNGNGNDIDFVIWGPFNDLAAAQADCGSLGAGQVVDCSFSATSVETPSIPGASAGDVYIMLITNFSNQPTQVDLFQTGGTGSTDCTILNPCNITNFSANISACDPATNTFGVTGSVSFTDAPTSGQMIVEDCNGNQDVFNINGGFSSPVNYSITGITADGAPCDVTVYFTDDPTCTQTIPYNNPVDCTPSCFMTGFSWGTSACDPADNTFILSGDVTFTDPPISGQLIVEDCNGNQQVFNTPFNSPIAYSIPGLQSDGTTNCSVTAYFTADPACTVTSNLYDNPTSCTCTADAGTYTQGTTGATNSPGPLSYDLCFGDELNITAMGDYDAPDDYTGVIAATYDPGIWLLVYDCPPTVTPPQSVNDDNCLLGIASTANGAWDIINNSGSGNTFWFVPVTMYSMVDGIYAISINGGDWCYDLGPAYEVTMLEDIVPVLVEDCQAGTATVTVSGGQPASDGSNFTASNLVPGSASFGNTTAGNGGTITVTGLQDGDNYSFDITDGTNCSITVSGTFVGLEDPSFTYPQSAYCADDPNPSPTITGDAGGTFTAPGGVSINANTGVINLGASTPGGPYTITYTTPDPTCFDDATFDITINPLPIVDGNDETICAGDMVTLNGTGADTYTWTGGVVDGVPFVGPATTTNYTVEGTITATGCVNTGIVTITVNPQQDPTFTTTDFCAGSASPAATVTGTSGGTFAYNPNPGDGSTVNSASGSITGGVSGTTYTIEYTTPGPCPATTTQTVTVNPLPVVDVPNYAVCVGGTITLTATGADTYSWSPGTYLNQTTGASVDCTPAAAINYTVTGTITATGCTNTDVTAITINPNAPISAGPDVTICAGESTNLLASGAGVGGTYMWQAPIGAGGANQTVTPAITTTYTVDGQDAQGCSGSDQVTVTVDPLPTAAIAGSTDVCEGDPAPTITFTGGNGTAPYTFTYTLNSGANQTIVSVGNTATITVPTGTAGTYSYDLVDVTDASSTTCMQAQTGNATVVVNPLPTATITGTTTICAGDPSPTITFTGANGTAPYTFTYNINGGANTTVVSAGNTATVSVPTGTAGTFDYNLVSVSDASSTACSQAQPATATIIINPLPTATISGTVDVCVGDPAPTVTFTGANGTAPYTFTYNVNGGANMTIVSVGNVATITVPTGAAGSYDYNLVSVADASATGCSQAQVGTATVTVNPLPTATIAGTASVCVGDPAPTITFTGANGTAPYTFTYTINGGANQTVVSVGNTATVNAPTGTAGTFNYDLVSVADASSTTCSQTQTGTATVIVNPMPTATIAGSVDICEGAPSPSVTFTGANGTAPYTFTYNINGGANQTVVSVGNIATVNVPSTPVGTYNYNLVSVEDASSTSCSQAQVGTATVNVNPNPTPVINGATEYCAGTFATLSTTVAYNTYLWSTGDATPTTDVTIADNPITVTVTNAFGCSGTSAVFTVTENSVIVYNSTIEICQGETAVIHGINQTTAGTYDQTFILGTGCDSTSSVELIVNPLPIIDAGLDQTLCDGQSVTLNATGAPNIAWDVVPVVNGAPFTQAVGTVTYTATGTDANGCVNTDQVDVTINPLPTATITGTTTVCEGDPAPTITFTGANGTAPYTFTYNINGGANQTVVSNGNVATVTAPTGTVGTFNYNLVSVSDASATNCSQTQTGTATVIVNSKPTATIAGTIDVCQGDTPPTITFTGADGTAPYTFTYNINGGANMTVVSTGNVATVTAPTGTVGTFNYNLVSVSDASATNCSQTQIGIATVTVNPLPTATIAGTATVCLGDPSPSITFTGANGTAPYTFTYNINGGANFTVVSAGNTATVSAPTGTVGTFNYNLVSVQDASSTACSQAQVGTATVTVNPLPTATIAGTITVCEGDAAPTVTFTGANGTSPYTFTYNINGGANQTVVSAGNTATISAPTNVAGTFNYNLVSVQDASATGCSQTQIGIATVIVNPLPTATVTGTVTVCEGDVAPTITFTGANGMEPYTFTYNINGSAPITVVSNGNIATVTVPTNVPGTYDFNLLNVSDASATGCSQAQVGTATVTVNPSPTATIMGDATICFGDPAPTVTFTGANGTAPYTFTYNINGGANTTVTSVGNTATVTAPAAVGTYNFNLVSVADASATGCSQAQAGTVTVVVNDLPAVFAGNDFVVCEGDQAVLTASGAQSYAWSAGQGTAVSDGVPFTPTTTDTYTVIGTDANGCVNTDDVVVTVEPLPVVSMTSDQDGVCAPATVTFTNTTPGNLTECIWTLSNGTTLTGCGSVTVTFPSGGLYDVTLTTTSANGCTNSETYFDYIYVEDNPVASFNPSSDQVTILDTEVHFDNTSTGAVSYVWNFGDETMSTTEFEPSHTFPSDEEGNYVVELIAYSPMGCTDTAWMLITVDEEVIFYVPNTFTPDGDDYNQTFKPVFTSGYDPYDFTLLIFNRWGEIVWESHDVTVGWDGTYAGSNDVQDGTFTWKIEFKTTINDERIRVTGHVNILR